MTNKYDFDIIDADDKPQITMGGHKYQLRYPTVEDIENIQKLKTDEERQEVLYSFIEPRDGEETPFRDVIRKQDIRVFKKFTEMVKKEFGVE